MPRQGRGTRGPRRRLATTVVVTVITTFSPTLASFSFAGLGIAGYRTDFNEPSTAGRTAAGGSNPDATRAGQLPKDLTQQLESAADIAIQFDNSNDAPLVISAASIKAVKAPLSEGQPPNRYFVSPDVLLQSATDRRVTGLVLSFACACSNADKTCSGEGGLDLTQGAEHRFKMKPQWDFFTLDGDPNRLRVSVAAVLLEGEDLWVNVDHARRGTQGTRAVRSDSGSSKPSSPLEAASSRQGDADQSEPRASVDSAKAVSDAACTGSSCPLNLIKKLGDMIGLPVVFEAAVEARVKKASTVYLRNLRRGDIIEILLRLNNLKYSRTGNQLNVKNDDSSESLCRLNLSN